MLPALDDIASAMPFPTPGVDSRASSAGASGGRVFSIETVARQAGVGKSSIYLRWADQTARQLDTLTACIDLPFHTDTGKQTRMKQPRRCFRDINVRLRTR